MKTKKRFTSVLVVVTFIVALILTFSSAFLNMQRNEVIDNTIEWVNPIYDVKYKEISWPTISTDELSKSVIGYDGKVDLEKFQEIFEEQFYSQDLGVDEEWITLDFSEDDGIITVNASSTKTMYNNAFITNPTHTYSYELIVNE